jgi:hypothetical protein
MVLAHGKHATPLWRLGIIFRQILRPIFKRKTAEQKPLRRDIGRPGNVGTQAGRR